MADRGDTHYNLSRMNLVFMLCSVGLMAIAVWMVVDDWDRVWKQHQRRFQELELNRAQEELAAMETPEFVAQKEQLEQEIQRLERELSDSEAYAEAQAELSDAEARHYKADSGFKVAKAIYNWERFQFKQSFMSTNDATPGSTLEDVDRSVLDEKENILKTAQLEQEAAFRALTAAQEKLQAITQDRDAAEARLTELNREVNLVSGKILGLESNVFNALRDAPGLDFVAPTLTVRKQVLPNLRKDYNFKTVPRVDMCSTCHVGIDNANYAGAEVPLNAHPRLDLFLSPSSPHPIDSFGCTVCHEGAAETLDFSRAVHTPEDHDQEHQWEHDHGWYHWHLWEWPMFPKKYTEAGCYSCHSMGETLETISPDAPKLAKGLALMERYACYSCHKIENWRDERKMGPTLRTIKEKISPEFARSWIAKPHDFREKSRMPQIYLLENAVSQEWDQTAVSAVQAYLWAASEASGVPAMPAELKASASAEEGEALFRQTGCTACHNSPVSEAHDYSDFGPDLAGIGSKVSEDWLYQWILDPQGWWPETRMPNMRVNPEEAAHMARYLAELNKEGWEPEDVPFEPEVLQQQAMAFLGRRFSNADSEAKIAEWRGQGGEGKVLEEVGRYWIQNHGCYSCHDIPGFETAMPIGTELSDWGNKNVHKLAFELWDANTPGHFEGAVHMSRHGFAELKLSNPRRFDRGLEVAPLDRARMPDFHLEEDEVEAITTVLLGLKDNSKTILSGALPKPDANAKALDQGAYLVRQNNCYGCHKFDMDTLTAVMEDEEGGTVTRNLHGLVALEDDDEEATYFQLWKTDPDLAIEEGTGAIGEKAELYWELENEDEDLIPWPVKKGAGGGLMKDLAEYYVEAGQVDDVDQAFALMPPILYREGEKVQAPWVARFLKAPFTLRPWLQVRMPRFTLDDEEARSLALYFPALARQEWASRYSRDLRAQMEMSVDDLAEAARILPGQILEIESGGRYNANAFGKVKAYGDGEGFQFDPPPQLPFEEIQERNPAYLADMETGFPGYLQAGASVVGKQGVDCYSCHIRNGIEPGGDKLSWGPDLAYAKERLRPDWIRRWVFDAQKIYPGTNMPTAFGLIADDPKVRALMPGHSPEQIIEAVKDFLMNSDRVQEGGEETAMLENGGNSESENSASGGN
ncbi:MAG: hypothetical protein DWQ01_19835 [Planctomycetota bacterium]|nr:MAG: hypothetical protein DWQ01_19835 [Planctomycetota bacterium]